MRLLQVVMLAALVGCGGVRVETTPVDPNPSTSLTPIDSDHIVQMLGFAGYASACAVDNYVLTASHVVVPFRLIPTLYDKMVGFAWSDPSGREGLLDPHDFSPYRDVAIMTPATGQVPVYQRVSLVPPQKGDIVRWVEYNAYNDDTDWFAPVEREATVVRVLAGHVAFDMEPISGASGACLFNAAGEVVGLVMWGLQETGVAVLLTGLWWTVGE